MNMDVKVTGLMLLPNKRHILIVTCLIPRYCWIIPSEDWHLLCRTQLTLDKIKVWHVNAVSEHILVLLSIPDIDKTPWVCTWIYAIILTFGH